MHFRSLRHTGTMPTAGAGANLRDLMDRMGREQSRRDDDLARGGQALAKIHR